MSTPFKGEPAQIAFSGQAVPVWQGSQGQSVPVLLFNQDQSNPVAVGYQNNLAVTAPNAVPLGPQSSVTMDGSRTIYANAPKGTLPLVVIPGGSSFFQRLVKLTLPTGATTGQRIVLNGLTGVIEVFNAANQLIASISPIAQNDGSGNLLFPVFTSYNALVATQMASLQGGVVDVAFGGGTFDMEPSTADIGALHMNGNGGGSLFEFFNALTKQIYSSAAYVGMATGGGPDTWHNIALGAGLTGTLRCIKTPMNAVMLDSCLSFGAAAASVVCGTLPDATYYPTVFGDSGNARQYAGGMNGTPSALAAPYRIDVPPASGPITVNIPATAAGSTKSALTVIWPID